MTLAKKTAPVNPPAHPWFAPEAIDFLRKLKRNNRREWFEARRDIYERELRQPMLALIEHVLNGMTSYAPDHLRPAKKCMLRIYRDIRFSADKSPYKTQVAAWWARHGAPKTSGSGYYLHLSATELVIAAGVYMPPPDQLYAIRNHLVAHHAEFARLLRSKKLLAKFEIHDPHPLSRPPKGFAADHPAIEWIKWRQWGVIATLPATEALKPSLPALVEERFRLAAPIVDFLNQPLLRAVNAVRKPLFGLY